MKGVAATIMIAVLGLPASAYAARPPTESMTFIDVAAQPAYQPDSPVKALTRMHRARHAERHRPEPRHRTANAGRAEARGKSSAPAAISTAPAPAAPSWAIEIARTVNGEIEAIAATLGTASDRAYLAATACPGYTMGRQGVATAIGRLNPTFVGRLAAAQREARRAGIDACIFSAYRPPAFGIGGFRDKFESAHSYGLAVDLDGIGSPGSRDAILYRRIAARHGVYGPYSVDSRAEWNHFEPTRTVLSVAPALRRTITAAGPKSLSLMWKVAEAVISPTGLAAVEPRERSRRKERRYVHHHLIHRHYASM